jgi:hypothetical protein
MFGRPCGSRLSKSGVRHNSRLTGKPEVGISGEEGDLPKLGHKSAFPQLPSLTATQLRSTRLPYNGLIPASNVSERILPSTPENP